MTTDAACGSSRSQLNSANDRAEEEVKENQIHNPLVAAGWTACHAARRFTKKRKINLHKISERAGQKQADGPQMAPGAGARRVAGPRTVAETTFDFIW